MSAPTLVGVRRDVPDLLDVLDASADVTPTDSLVKEERLRAIQAVNDRDGNFDANRVRQECAPWARKTPLAGSTTNGLVRSGKAVEVHDTEAMLGNSEHRASHRKVFVYALTERIA